MCLGSARFGFSSIFSEESAWIAPSGRVLGWINEELGVLFDFKRSCSASGLIEFFLREMESFCSFSSVLSSFFYII
jgi:hypothetical protein